MYILETEDLGLRQLTAADTDDLYVILSDRETMRYYPQPFSREGVARWVQKSIASYADYGFGLWGMVLKSEARLIGQCGISLQDIDGKLEREIGYHLNKQYWNRGYTTRLAKQCLIYGFRKLGMAEIFIHTYVKNLPSIRVAEKLGMSKRKEYPKRVTDTLVMPHVVFSMRREEFLQ